VYASVLAHTANDSPIQEYLTVIWYQIHPDKPLYSGITGYQYMKTIDGMTKCVTMKPFYLLSAFSIR